MATAAPPRVVVAEDDPDILALVTDRLTRSGYEVLTATDGAEALRITFAERPDLVVLDVMMPRVDGLGVTRAIREHPATERTPVLLLTARVQEGDVTRGFEAGADDYLKKPFSPQELRARVQAALGRR